MREEQNSRRYWRVLDKEVRKWYLNMEGWKKVKEKQALWNVAQNIINGLILGLSQMFIPMSGYNSPYRNKAVMSYKEH